MTRFYTSIEESKKLLELGLSAESADMYYFEHEPFIDTVTGHYDVERMNTHKEAGFEIHPCWSLGALLEVIPRKIYGPIPKDHPVEFQMNKLPNDRYIVHYFDDTGLQHGKAFTGSLIGAAYNMVVWLLENGYVKKGE